MTYHSALVRGALVGVLVLVLAGCAAPTAAYPHTSAPTATSTPTRPVASEAGSRVPISCADLVDPATVSAIAGPTAKVDQDERTAPTDIPSIAELQFGAQSCVWDGLGATSGSYLQVDVAPDSKVAFQGRFAAIMADQTAGTHPTATENVAGDQSGYWCADNLDALGADSNLPICEADMLVGNYWVSLTVNTVAGLTRLQLTSGLASAMTEIARKLMAAGDAAAQWTPPATTPPAFCQDTNSTSQVRSITGDPSLAPQAPSALAVFPSTIGLVGVEARCDWIGTTGGIDIDLLAGGSWAFPGFTPVAPGDLVIQGPYASASIPGTTAALLACDSDSCNAYLEIGTTVAHINTSVGLAASKTQLAAFAGAIAAS